MSDNITKGVEFEKQCLNYLKLLGLEDLRLTNVNDQGADLIGKFGGTIYVFQCKKHIQKQGNRAVQEAIASKTYYEASRCAVISESGFTNSAFRLAKPNYCLLFTADQISTAVDSQQNFGDLIEGITFPEHVHIEHDYDIIKAYERIKSELGHAPRNSDIDPTTRYHIRKQYGNLTNLINQLGDRSFSRRPTDEEIKKEYLRVKSKTGGIPTLRDIERESNFSRNCFSSYPFTKLQRECGDRPNIERGISKEDLISAFQEVRTKLSRIPSVEELNKLGKYRASYYSTRWGNIGTFFSEMGISRRLSYSEHELLIIYLLLKKILEIRQNNKYLMLNHTALKKIRFEEKEFISPSIFRRRFGSWERFKDKLNTDAFCQFEKMLDEITQEFTENLTKNSDDDQQKK